jgi:hypothetical protein
VIFVLCCGSSRQEVLRVYYGTHGFVALTELREKRKRIPNERHPTNATSILSIERSFDSEYAAFLAFVVGPNFLDG